MQVYVQIDQTPLMCMEPATVHELLAKHPPNIVLDQIQVIGSMANAYFLKWTFFPPNSNSSQVKNAIFV